ncbi:hypothetical protein [Marinicrinis lubricantis]|uniref:Methyl-accepting chemotaxis protein n=1 Tax=Marinicrinis lubricantis TaxID=2086470 RepID=A0ABW1ITG0_9BACL
MKKRKRKKSFIRSSKGSASILLMIVLAAIFLFQAVFVDFARIKAAEYETERALKAALRSIYAGFDKDLTAYGLYGVANPDAAESRMTELVQKNGSTEEGDGLFPHADLHGVEVRHTFTLADHTVFEQQILEEMKYAAPIEFMTELYDSWNGSGLNQNMQEASKLSKQIEELEAIIEKREKALDDAWDQVEEFIGLSGLMAEIANKYSSRFSEINELASKIGVHQLGEVQQSIEDINRRLESKRQNLANLSAQAAAQAQNSENGQPSPTILESMGNIRSQINSLNEQLSNLTELMENIVAYTALITQTLADLSDDSSRVQAEQKGIVDKLKEAEAANKELEEKLAKYSHEVTEGVQVYDPSFFQDYQTKIGGSVSVFNGLVHKFNTTSFITGDRYTRVHNDLVDQVQQIGSRAAATYQELLIPEQKRKDNNQKVKDEKEKQKNRTKDTLSKISNLLNSCSVDYSTSYMRLEGIADDGLYQKYLKFNKQGGSESGHDTIELDDESKVGKDALNLTDKISSLLLTARDEAYLNEFALTRFNYRTLVSPEEAKSTGRPTSYSLSHPYEHPLMQQEAEYILYGFGSCELNHGAAFSEMYLTRLAIHLAEELAKPNKGIAMFGSPLLVFLWAVAEAAIHAWGDMQQLVAGKEIPLSDRWAKSFLLDYKDYLRIFYFLHSNDAKMMSRMQALIELNTGDDLLKRPVYTEAVATFSLKPVFIPFVLSWLGKDVKEGETQIVHKAIFSY